MIGDRLSILLLMLIVGLAALAAWQWHSVGTVASSAQSAPPPDVPLAQIDAQSTFVVPPLAQLTQTVERPMFSRARRPAPVEVIAKSLPQTPLSAAKATPLSIELSAVIIEADRQFALFSKVAQGSLLRAEVGQSVDGWVVSEIRGDGVSLERGSEKQILVLRTFKAPVRKAPVKKARKRRTAARTPASAATRAANPATPSSATKQPRRPRRRPQRRSIQRPSPTTTQ